MIRLVNGGQPGDRDLDAMYRGRKQVFVDRLGWPLVVTKDGREIDQFDDFDPLYLIAHDRYGQVKGSMRLLPTTGPTLLTSVFGEAFDQPVDIRSASVWEVTRFCVHAGETDPSPKGINRITAELCQGLAEVGLKTGLSHVIGIFDDRMRRVYSRIGWAPECLAKSLPGSQEGLQVGLWDITEAALAAMRSRSGIAGSVLEDDEALAAMMLAG